MNPNREPTAQVGERAQEALGVPARVSVVMSVRNEATCIDESLRSVCAQDYPHEHLEIIVVDGDSGDETVEVVSSARSRDGRIRILSNPDKWVASGLNIGFKAATGEVIVRVDGHCVIPETYVSTCVRTLFSGGAECVGGPLRTVGAGAMGRAIALAMSTGFGVGDATFRYARTRGHVDHVPFGAYRRELFREIGLFDEELIRNQDDELSLRIRQLGGRIVLEPQIPVQYLCRNDLVSLWKQYYGYGYWKPTVLAKRGLRAASWRLFAPPLLVLSTSVAFCSAIVLASPVPMILTAGVYGLYLALAGFILSRHNPFRTALLAVPAIATLHLAYGSGFLAGALPSFRRARSAASRI